VMTPNRPKFQLLSKSEVWVHSQPIKILRSRFLNSPIHLAALSPWGWKLCNSKMTKRLLHKKTMLSTKVQCYSSPNTLIIRLHMQLMAQRKSTKVVPHLRTTNGHSPLTISNGLLTPNKRSVQTHGMVSWSRSSILRTISRLQI
jgi:hypothetical protein